MEHMRKRGIYLENKGTRNINDVLRLRGNLQKYSNKIEDSQLIRLAILIVSTEEFIYIEYFIFIEYLKADSNELTPMKPALHSLFGSLIFLCSCSNDHSSSPDVSDFHLAEGFQIELIAAEPLVKDPVAMEIDEQGDWFVVEMPGYPLDVKGSGRVIKLLDKDKDGLPDERVVFADELVLPNGIMKWKEGWIVTDAPNVLYLEDTDGDDKADHIEVMLTGFSRSNPQHNMNSPSYGLDNWIYLGHEGAFITKTFVEEFGDEGTRITFPNVPDAPSLPKNANERAVRFQPEQHKLEMLSGSTQFGYSFDDWGHLFYTSNAHHLFHEVIAARYLEGGKQLPLTSTTQYLPSYGPGAEIFPMTDHPEHQVLTDVGTITSSCGLTLYQGGAFPEAYDQLSFIAEPVHNLIHTDKLMGQGASYVAERQFERKEFLASRDSWFRPVNFYIGPSGDLYVLDYHRQYIEHPEWMAEEVVTSGQLYNGKDKGRIYKISSTQAANASKQSSKKLGEMTDPELIPLLADKNVWWRRNAQRLLVHRDRNADQLQQLKEALIDVGLETESDLGLLHTLWTLEGLRQVDAKLIRKALTHKTAGLRENALKMIELHPELQQELKTEVLALQNDPNSKVRFQLLCSLSLYQWAEAEPIIQNLLQKGIEDDWTQIMALKASSQSELSLIQSMNQGVSSSEQEKAASFISKASEMLGRSNETSDIKRLISTSIRPSNGIVPWWGSAALEGLAKGMKEVDVPMKRAFEPEKRLLISQFDPVVETELRAAAIELLSILGLPNQGKGKQLDLAERILRSREGTAALQVDAIHLLGLENTSTYTALLLSLIQPTEAIDVQKAALQELNDIAEEDREIETYVFSHWHDLTSSLQQEALKLFSRREASSWRILAQVEKGNIQAATISWPVKLRLLNHWNDDIKREARELLVAEDHLAEEILKRYELAVEGRGNIEGGKEVFEAVCSSCHQMGGEYGMPFGPDLASIRNRTKVAILQDVLLPNKAIADGYELWDIQLNNGDKLYGIIAEELNDQLLIREASGNEIKISRSHIDQLRSMKQSGMPEGLADQISVEEMKHLLAYLKNPF